MISKHKEARVCCPLSNKPEAVHVYLFDPQHPDSALFNGCDGSFHNCHECSVVCRQLAIDYLIAHPDLSAEDLLHMP